MNTELLVAIATTGGGIVGALINSAVRAARVTNRGQAHVQDQQSRRDAYAICASALLERYTAGETLLSGMRRRTLDVDTARDAACRAQDLRPAVVQALGRVMVEGPRHPAHRATVAARHLDVWIEALESYAAEGIPESLWADEQWQYRERDRLDAEHAVDDFTAACRRTLHPDDDATPRRGLGQRWREWWWDRAHA